MGLGLTEQRVLLPGAKYIRAPYFPQLVLSEVANSKSRSLTVLLTFGSKDGTFITIK